MCHKFSFSLVCTVYLKQWFPLGTPMLEMFALWYCEAFYINVSTKWHIMSLTQICLIICKKAQHKVRRTWFKLIKLRFISTSWEFQDFVSEEVFFSQSALQFNLSIIQVKLSTLWRSYYFKMVAPCVHSWPCVYWFLSNTVLHLLWLVNDSW